MQLDKKVTFTPVTMGQAGMKKDLKFTPVLPEGLSSAGHSLKGRVRFIPSVEGFTGQARTKSVKDSFTLDWWTPTSLYQYDALMVSAFYGLKRWDFRDYYNIPRRNFLFVADSGGYQIYSQRAHIEPERILMWQEKNADVGMTLDVPPLDPSQNIVGDFEAFRDAANRSKRYYEVMHRKWTEQIELMKVIHGASPERLDFWRKTVEDLEFSGYAFSPKPINVETTAIVLAYAREIGAKKVHIFLGSGEAVTPVIVYAKKWFDRLTFDSSSFSTSGAKYRRYYLPYKASRSIDFGGDYKGKLERLPCLCPVCQLATIDDLRVEKGSHATKTASLSGGLIALHNLYVYLQYYYFLTALSYDGEIYRSFLEGRGLSKTVRMLDFLDSAEKTGFHDAYSKFFRTTSMHYT